MKVKIKFSVFFMIGLFVFVFYLGLMMAFLFEFVIPLFGIGYDDDLIVFLFVFILAFVSGGILFSLFFIKPLLFMISMAGRLSAGNYDLSTSEHEIYTTKGKLKLRYFLYKEAIVSFNDLADNLSKIEIERTHLKEAKESWIRGISHDIKTPLSYVIGYSALLSNNEYTWNDEERQNYLSQIYTKGTYIESLIEDLNFTFKLELDNGSLPMSVAGMNLVPFMQNLVADIANNPKASNYDFSLETDSTDLWVNGDEKLLLRAFQNILMNAINHNPIGTKIKILMEQHQDVITISICDNGVGLDKEMQHHIFTKYYSTKTKKDSSYSGGMGLVIVKSIIDAHGGNIHVESEKNKGTSFIISLPYEEKNL